MRTTNLVMIAGLLCGIGVNPARVEKAWGIDSKSLLVSFDTDRPQFLTSLHLIFVPPLASSMPSGRRPVFTR